MAQIDGTDGNDTLVGGDGNDVINGGAGNDALSGGGGDDLLIGGSGENILDGGAGIDTVDYSWAPWQVWVDLLNADYQNTVRDASGARERFVGIENLKGSNHGDFLNGDTASNVIEGGGGDDRLTDGGGGDDILRGGDGSDFIGGYEGSYGVRTAKYYGDAGNDYFSLSDYNTDSRYQVYGGEGNDTIVAQEATNAVISGEAGDDLIKIRDGEGYRLTFGDGHDRLELWASSAVGDRITVTDFHATGASADVVDLGAYAAYQLARPYVAHTAMDWDFRSNPFAQGLLRLAQDGADTVLQIRRPWDLNGAFQTVLRFENTDRASFGAEAFNGYDPNGGAVTSLNLTGTAAAEYLLGGGGADTIHGGDGADTVDGGLGDDWLYGDAGDDSVRDEVSGDDRLYGGGGDDNLNVFRGMGQTFTALVLDGGLGDDRLTLSSYVQTAAAAVVLSGGEGKDSLSLFGSTRALLDGGADDDELTFLGFQSVGISVLSGGDGNDRITSVRTDMVVMNGDAGDDRLESGAGGDWLDGGAGFDILIGGAGDDTFVVGDGQDILEELVGGGRDTVMVQSSYELHANFEVARALAGFDVNLFGRDDQGDHLVGNERANYLGGRDGDDGLFGEAGNDSMDGGAGADWLDGGDGSDSIYGGAGNDGLAGGDGADWLDGASGDDMMFGGMGDDIYVVDSVADRVIESSEAGTDTVLSSVIFELRGDVEILRLSGSAAINGFGSGDNERLYGNSGANYLGGLGGADSIFGGDGDDSIDGGTGNDWLDGEAGNDILAGSDGNDGVAGGAGADWIDGGAGLDVLYGGTGSDTLIGGAGHDQFVFQPGDGADRILDFVAGGGEDAINLLAYQGTGVTWSLTQVNADTLVSFTNGDSILLAHVLVGDLQQQGSWIF